MRCVTFRWLMFTSRVKKFLDFFTFKLKHLDCLNMALALPSILQCSMSSPIPAIIPRGHRIALDPSAIFLPSVLKRWFSSGSVVTRLDVRQLKINVWFLPGTKIFPLFHITQIKSGIRPLSHSVGAKPFLLK